jgi:hypothetical protein
MSNERKIRYNIATYTSFSHNHVIALLSSNEAEYRYEEQPTEEYYSRFTVVSDLSTFEKLREASKENNGAAFNIEHGSY